MQSIPRKHSLIILLVFTVLGIVYWYAFNFLRLVEFDTPSFIGASRLMFHIDEGYNFQSRLGKPLVLIFPGLLELVFNINAKYGFLIQNILAHYALGFVIYKIVFHVTANDKLALLGSIAYATCNPFAVYSLFYLVDTVGWLLGSYTIYITLKNLHNKALEFKPVILIAAFASLGMLCKESAIVGLVFLLTTIFFCKQSFFTRVKFILIAFFVWLVPFLASNLITEYMYGVSIFSRMVEQLNNHGFVYYNRTNFQQLFRVFDVYWFLATLGIALNIKEFKQNSIYLILFVSSFLCLLLMPIYPFIVDRILFMIAPLLVVFIVLGANFFRKQKAWVILIGGIINVVATYVIYKYNLSGILLKLYLLYIIFLLLVILFQQTKRKYLFR